MKKDLSKQDPVHFRNTAVMPETIISWLENEDAYWQYQGEPNPKKPHAELSSGKCSNGFFDCQRILSYPNITEILAYQLACKIKVCMRERKIKKIDVVVVPPYTGMIPGYEVAKVLGAKFMFTEKDPKDPKGKRMLWQRMTIPANATVLLIDDIVTTFSTIEEMRKAINESNPRPVKFVPFVGTIVFRPEDSKKKNKYEVISLVKKEVKNFEPQDCPYCAVGSKRLRPKKNWAALIGKN